MAAFSYTIQPVDGVKRSSRRAIAFLSCSGDSNIDAGVVFGGLNQKREREVRSRFDYWIDGSKADRWFHGWPNDADYKQCFVFKWKDNQSAPSALWFPLQSTADHEPVFSVMRSCIPCNEDQMGNGPA
jgi:hypothetical protein